MESASSSISISVLVLQLLLLFLAVDWAGLGRAGIHTLGDVFLSSLSEDADWTPKTSGLGKVHPTRGAKIAMILPVVLKRTLTHSSLLPFIHLFI